MKEFGLGVLVIVAVIGAIISASFVSFGLYRYFAPREAEVQREVFENTKGYNDGMIRDLENLQMEYQHADKTQKEAMKAVILHRFSVYDKSRLPIDLRKFYDDLRGGY